MDEDRTRWNSRYASEPWYLGEKASPFLIDVLDRFIHLIPGRRALDIACGEGRNSLHLARRGFQVTAVDISDVGIAKGRARASGENLPIRFIELDLDSDPLPAGPFDLVLNFNFLQRGLLADEVSRLVPGGILIFDTIVATPSVEGTPSRSFYLQPGEIHTLFGGFDGEVILTEETPGDPMPTARLLFRRTPHT